MFAMILNCLFFKCPTKASFIIRDVLLGKNISDSKITEHRELSNGCIIGWVDIGTRTKVPLKFVTYLSKITKINEKSVLTQ
jgi:hypothetical protein